MSTATFTVPLTARVLRAILADIEGGTGCGCHAPATRQKFDRPAPVTDSIVLGNLVHTQVEQYINAVERGESIMQATGGLDTTPLTSGIVEEGNPFVVPATLTPEPFILTPDGIVPVDEVIDPFVLQTATPPVPPVPMPPVVTPVAPPTSIVPLDSEGLPWDKRIHASTRTRRVGDDTWKLMKGVDKALVEQVKAELRATMAVPAAPVVQPPQHPAFAEPTNYSGAQSGGYVPPAVVPHLSGSWSPETGHVVGVPAPPAPPAPVATPQPPAAPGAPTTFSDFVTYATNKIVGKQFSKQQLQDACANEGITSMPMLENRPDLIPAIWKFLESISIQASSVGGE